MFAPNLNLHRPTKFCSVLTVKMQRILQNEYINQLFTKRSNCTQFADLCKMQIQKGITFSSNLYLQLLTSCMEDVLGVANSRVSVAIVNASITGSSVPYKLINNLVRNHFEYNSWWRLLRENSCPITRVQVLQGTGSPGGNDFSSIYKYQYVYFVVTRQRDITGKECLDNGPKYLNMQILHFHIIKQEGSFLYLIIVLNTFPKATGSKQTVFTVTNRCVLHFTQFCRHFTQIQTFLHDV